QRVQVGIGAQVQCCQEVLRAIDLFDGAVRCNIQGCKLVRATVEADKRSILRNIDIRQLVMGAKEALKVCRICQVKAGVCYFVRVGIESHQVRVITQINRSKKIGI